MLYIAELRELGGSFVKVSIYLRKAFSYLLLLGEGGELKSLFF